MITAAEVIREAADQLAAAGFESPRLDAEVLLRHVLQIDRTHLFLRLRDEVTAGEILTFERLIEGRLSGLPVAYLTGRREFMGLDFSVGPGVLVPRPETEMLVEWALGWIGEHRPESVVDVGTGSGAIILSIGHALRSTTQPRLFGSDLSADALRYATRNRLAFGLDERVHMVQGNLLEWLANPVDLVLANLPYLRPDQVVDNSDIQAEPEIALISGDDGFRAISKLIADLPKVLNPGGAAMFELDPDQASRAANFVREALPGATSRIIHDLSGRARFVVAELGLG